MNKEVKCPHCQEWVSNDSPLCSSCRGILDRNEVVKLERESASTQIKIIKQKGKIDLWIEKTAESKNPVVIVMRKILQVVWFIYLGILSFIIWLIAWLAG